MAWTEDQRARFRALKAAGAQGALTESERAELCAYVEELDREEESALAASLARADLDLAAMERELAEARASAEALEQIADAQRALRDEARECLGRLRARRLELTERARAVGRRAAAT